MKALKALAVFGTVGVAGFYAMNNFIHEALISRYFVMPDNFGEKVSEKGENRFEEKIRQDKLWLDTLKIEEYSRGNNKDTCRRTISSCSTTR